MTIRHADTNSYDGGSDKGTGANSLVLDGQYFVARTAGVVDKAAVAGTISGVNYTVETFAVDNETVALKEAKYAPASLGRLYEIDVIGAVIAKTDEDALFDIAANAQEVNGGSAGTGVQLKLVEFLNPTKGVFTIVV